MPAENVTAGDGSDELISIIMNAFLQKGDTVMTLERIFDVFVLYVRRGVQARTVHQKRRLFRRYGRCDSDCKKENARIIIFSNPCNPTSRVIGRSDVEKLVSSVDSLVVLDEAYMDFQIRAYSPSLTDTTT